ncbi:MAG: ubiquinone biosynthesis regulatory protein kinase UbiB, partial [Legionellaceae bacterium]
VQPQLILLQKTLLAVEGLGRQLDPDLDLWTTAKPFLEQWIKTQRGPKALFHHLRDNLPFFIEELPHMPRLLNEVLSLSKQKYLREQDDLIKKTKPETLWKRNLAFMLIINLGIFIGLYHWNFIGG